MCMFKRSNLYILKNNAFVTLFNLLDKQNLLLMSGGKMPVSLWYPPAFLPTLLFSPAIWRQGNTP